MALTKAERQAAAGARNWAKASGRWGYVKDGVRCLCPAGEVASLRGVQWRTNVFGALSVDFVGLGATGALEQADRALRDVALYLGYRDRTDMPAEDQYLDGLAVDHEAMRARLVGLVEGRPRKELPKLPRRSMLEGG
jgi:hypothetical protein